jgi:hypothetical protein
MKPRTRKRLMRRLVKGVTMDRRLRLWTVAAAALAAALAAAGGFAYAQVTDDALIKACAKTDNGQLRLDRGGGCLASEDALQWNQTGPQGPQGVPGPQGPPGISHVDERFFVRSLADPGTWLPIVSGTWPDVRPFMTHVLTMHLDKGNYAVTAEVIAENGSGHGIVVCLLGNSTVGFTVAQSGVGNAAGFALQQTFEAQGTFVLDAPGDLELSCFNAPPNEPAGNPRVGFADVLATRVDTVTSTQE